MSEEADLNDKLRVSRSLAVKFYVNDIVSFAFVIV